MTGIISSLLREGGTIIGVDEGAVYEEGTLAVCRGDYDYSGFPGYKADNGLFQGLIQEEEVVKTALFEALIESCTENCDGTITFTLEGKSYIINDHLEISKIAQTHDYIIIY